jgi:hypothetical protein
LCWCGPLPVVYRRSSMRGGRSATWVVLGLGLGLSGCPGTDLPGVLDDGFGAGSSSTGGPGITTFNSTIDPTLPPDGGSMEAESAAEVTTMGVVDGTTTEPGTTSSTTDTTTEPGTTTDPTTTGGPSTTDPGTTSSAGSSSSSTTGGGCNDVPGNYESCLNAAGMIDNTPCMAPGDSTCIYTGMMGAPSAAVCAITDCVDACDCPAGPATGSAVVSCDDVTGNPADLFCYLDCAGGETCPTGMTCFGGFLCVWPGPGAGGTPYGDCFTDPSVCGLEGVCLNDGAMPTIGVCTQDCVVLGDCPASPGGTAPVSCEDVTGDGASECILDCSGGGSCPVGMTCFSSFLCAWN